MLSGHYDRNGNGWPAAHAGLCQSLLKTCLHSVSTSHPQPALRASHNSPTHIQGVPGAAVPGFPQPPANPFPQPAHRDMGVPPMFFKSVNSWQNKFKHQKPAGLGHTLVCRLFCPLEMLNIPFLACMGGLAGRSWRGFVFWGRLSECD